MRLRRLIWLPVLLLAVSAPVALAQEENAASENAARVQLEVESRFNAEVEGEVYQLPADLMKQLTRQQALDELTVQTGDGRTRLTARFQFDSMEAFTRWYASDETVSLMKTLTAKGGVGSTQLTFTLARDSQGTHSPSPP